MSSIRFRENHDPDASLNYQIDWSEYLADGDGVASATWSASPSGLTIVSSSVDGDTTIARVSGGVAGTTYTLTCHMTMDSGQIDDRSITLHCVQR